MAFYPTLILSCFFFTSVSAEMTDMTCLFSDDCICEFNSDYEYDGPTYEFVNCTAPPNYRSMYPVTVNQEMIVSAPLNILSINAFAAFRRIEKLSLNHQKSSDYFLHWDDEAFNGVEVGEIQIASLYVPSLPKALTKLIGSLTSLSIGNFPPLPPASFDLSDFGQLTNLQSFSLFDDPVHTSLNCTNLTNINWPSKKKIIITMQNTILYTIDPEIENLLIKYPSLTINVRNTTHLICTQDIKWILKYNYCTKQLNFQDAFCGYEDGTPIMPIDEYLHLKFPDFSCNSSIPV